MKTLRSKHVVTDRPVGTTLVVLLVVARCLSRINRVPVIRQLFILAKLSHLTHLRIGEYMAPVAAAD